MLGTPACPCGTGLPYDDCCGRLHRGEATAPTAEALMRSRYAAYARGDEAYLRRTWHPSTRPKKINFDDQLRWTGLDVLTTTGGGLFDTEGTVLFRAHYTQHGRRGQMPEDSRFVREHGEWRYLGLRGC